MALLSNPQDILSTPYGYSGQMAPETAVAEQQLNRRRLIANMLMQNGMQQPQGRMAGRFFVGANPLERVANLAQAGMGAYLTNRIDNQSKDLMTQDRQSVVDAIKAYQDSKKPQQYQSPQESSGMPPTLPPQAPPAEPGQALPPRPDGPYNGEVGAAAMPEAGVQSAQPPMTPQPPSSIAGQDSIQGMDMGKAAPADMGQMVPPPQATPEQPLPSPAPAPTPTAPPVRFVEPPAPKTTMDDLAALMTHQHPQVRQYGQFLAQQMQHEQAMAAAERNRQQDFAYKKYEHETPSANAITAANAQKEVAQASNDRALESMNLRHADDMKKFEQDANQYKSQAEYQKAKLDLDAKQANERLAFDRDKMKSDAMIAKAGKAEKAPPGYRFLPNGDLEAIKNGPADLKQQGAFNQDTAMLQNSNANLDRLGAATNELLNHPGINGITGVRGKVPDVPGTDAANARALLNTLKSQIGFGVLQEMRNNSKTGGALGAVSDAEHKLLQNNLAALDTTQGVDQFKKQLKTILDYTEGAKGRLRDTFNMKHKTGEPVPMSPSTGKGPSVGTIDGGYRFKGGDPSKPESWEKAN